MPKYSVSISGHATSVSLEKEFWHELNRIAHEKNMSVNALISYIDETHAKRDDAYNLSSALRLFVLDDLKVHSKHGSATRSDTRAGPI